MQAETAKVCTGCGVPKSRDEFHRTTAAPDGLSWRCKECNRAAARAWRQANPEKARELRRRSDQKRDYHAKHQAAMEPIRAAKAKPGADCGLEFAPEHMHFDHVRGEKEFKLSKGWAVSRERLEAELAKCEVRCWDCHLLRHGILT